MVSDFLILIVEDSEGDRLLIKYHLKKMGLVNFIEANNGEMALKLLGKSKADLIIADRYMPNMDGLALYQKLQANEDLKSIPFLMVTAEHIKEEIARVMTLGIRNYIIKPIDPDNLQAKVKRLLKIE